MAKSIEGWVAKSVAHQLATAALWVRIQTSLKKIINGRHKQRSGLHTLARQKIIEKKTIIIYTAEACAALGRVYTLGPELHLNIYTLQSPVLHLNVFPLDL